MKHRGSIIYSINSLLNRQNIYWLFRQIEILKIKKDRSKKEVFHS